MLVKTRPGLAGRIAFLATARVAEGAPPSSAAARILALPVSIERVRQLLGKSP